MDYSNAGYGVLAAIVEKVSGKSYEGFLREQLFKPAGMMLTGYVLPTFNRSILPHGYNGETDEGSALDHAWSSSGPYWNLRGNGGIFSTVGDMYKWYQKLQGNKVLSADARKKLFTPFMNNYAYGWNVTKSDKGTIISHGGSNDVGFNARFQWYADKNVVIIAMSNAGEYYGGTLYSAVVRDKLSSLIFGEDFSRQKQPIFIKLDAPNLKKYEGIYRMASGSEFIVALESGSLTVEPVGQEAVNALTSSTDKPSYSQSTMRSQEIVAGVVKKDYAELRQNMTSDDSATRFRGFFEKKISDWEKKDGSYKGFQVLGTISTWWADDSVPATIVRLNFENSSHVFRFHWKDGKITGLGGEGIRSPITIPLKPISNDSFLGWHLVLTQNIEAQFTTEGSNVTGVTVTSEGKISKAIKVK